MAVEYPVTINEFNEAWPDGLDSKSQGDDHIRNIKGALKRTFPNVQGVSTISHHRLNELAKPGMAFVTGMVLIWSGDISMIPVGWRMCNGQGTLSNGQAIPNLINRFVACAGGNWANHQTGGAYSHNHVVNIGGTALTVAQLPPHHHEQYFNGWTPTGIDRVGIANEPLGPINPGDGDRAKITMSSTAGSGSAHTHPGSSSEQMHIPPFYSMYYIIKD